MYVSGVLTITPGAAIVTLPVVFGVTVMFAPALTDSTAPGSPLSPFGPVGPVGPAGPVGPVGPVSPCCPGSP